MKTIQAFGCTPGTPGRKKAASTAVCFVLDKAHADHTMRVFMRDQPADRVVRALAPGEAARLLGQQAARSKARRSGGPEGE
jgi:hypothetical protein